jgi:hypothetical protein
MFEKLSEGLRLFLKPERSFFWVEENYGVLSKFFVQLQIWSTFFVTKLMVWLRMHKNARIQIE